jgi:aspartyl-tRNA(Asn)/glutamyl-tRNA(Gln) amidotransferase subunit A
VNDVFRDALDVVERWRSAGPHPDVAPAIELALPGASQLPQLRDVPRVEPTVTLEQARAAIAERDPGLHAFVELLDAPAGAAGPDAPLHGVVVSVKDLFAVAGSVTRAGSDAFERHDTQDSPVVARLREAGALIVGKTATHEFAMGVITPGSRNPHDPSRIAGGSSGGAAISVASGMSQLAIGSDTRGSIRIPAALCGVVGLKPTFGTIPIEGAVPLSWTTDHCGVIAGRVADAAAVSALFAHPRPPDRPLAAITVGTPPAAWRAVERPVERAVSRALAALEPLVAAVHEVDRPAAEDFDDANLASIVVSRCEALAHHRGLGLDLTLYGEDVRTQLAAAETAGVRDYIDAQRLRTALQRRLLAAFAGVDLLVMPTVPVLAPPVDALEGIPLLLTRNVAIWSFAGFPALSLPLPAGEDGLPAALQIVGPPHADAAVLACARALETALR